VYADAPENTKGMPSPYDRIKVTSVSRALRIGPTFLGLVEMNMANMRVSPASTGST